MLAGVVASQNTEKMKWRLLSQQAESPRRIIDPCIIFFSQGPCLREPTSMFAESCRLTSSFNIVCHVKLSLMSPQVLFVLLSSSDFARICPVAVIHRARGGKIAHGSVVLKQKAPTERSSIPPVL
jgi:hypothetical protein